MKMKTLAQVMPKASYSFEPISIQNKRPEVQTRAQYCIALWSIIDALYGQALAFGIKGEPRPMMEMYLSITSAPAKSAALKAAIRHTMKPKYRDMFLAIYNLGAPLRTERDQLAHWIFGISDDLPKDLLLLDPRNDLRHLTHTLSEVRKRNYRDIKDLSPGDIKVLSVEYLDDLISRLSHHYYGLQIFVGIFFAQRGGPWVEEMTASQYRRLYSDPEIHQAILNLHEGRKPKQKRPRR